MSNIDRLAYESNGENMITQAPRVTQEMVEWVVAVADVPAKLGDKHDTLVWKAAQRDLASKFVALHEQQRGGSEAYRLRVEE